MADKDDLFQEEDGTNSQDQDRDEPSSDEDDDIIDLLDTVEIPAGDIDEDIIELEDMVEVSADEIIELTEEAQGSVDDDDVLDLTEVVTDEDEPEDDILELTDIAVADDAEDDGVLDLTQKAEASEVDDDIIDLTETVDDIDIDEATMGLTEPDEPSEPDQEEQIQETAALPSTGYEEDKELLELIDDIQATLNDEPVAAHISDQEEATQADDSIDVDFLEDDATAYTFLDDDEFIGDGEIPESETEFVDHLGIDLTSEIERRALEESQEAVMEDVKPTEKVEPGIAPVALETAVEQALTNMLEDENNPLAKAIENAVKKALGQGADT